MPKVTEQYRSSRRSEISDAASRVFRAKGFRGASMADIIEESGLSAGAIYGHFSGKAAIVQDVASRAASARIDIEGLLVERPMQHPSEMLGIVMRQILSDVGDSAVLVQIWGEAVTDPTLRSIANDFFKRLEIAFERYLRQWHQIRTGCSEVEAETFATGRAFVYLGVSQGFLLQSALLEDFDAEASLDNIVNQLSERLRMSTPEVGDHDPHRPI